MPRKSPGARERVLGAELRDLREAAGLTLTQAAGMMGWSKPVLSKLETGNRNISPDEVYALGTIYGVFDERRDQLMARARADEPGASGLPREDGALASYEAQAADILNWELLLIPGLLQTVQYTEAWLRSSGYTADQVERRVTARLRRQQVLRTGVAYTALIGEGALRSPVGGGKVMSAQLRDIAAASQRANITVRVTPAGRVHRGMVTAFLLCQFAAAPPIAYVELLDSAVFRERDEARAYVDTAAQLLAVSMSETESREAILTAASLMEDMEDFDER